MTIIEKVCARCCLTRPASEFSKGKRGKDGLQGWCKDCWRAYRKSNKDVNKDAVSERHRKYYATNRAAVLERQRQYRESNMDVVREQRRKYREVASRRFREGGRPADLPWPDCPIAYSAAHYRVKATYGAASKHPCIACGEQAHAWAYDHSDPNPLIHKDATGRWAGKPIPYSPDPNKYDPMCRSCHTKRDRWGGAP